MRMQLDTKLIKVQGRNHWKKKNIQGKTKQNKSIVEQPPYGIFIAFVMVS